MNAKNLFGMDCITRIAQLHVRVNRSPLLVGHQPLEPLHNPAHSFFCFYTGSSLSIMMIFSVFYGVLLPPIFMYRVEIEVISNLSNIQIIQHIFVIEVKRKMEHLYNLGIKVEPDIEHVCAQCRL